ncbi:unnamed protein product [Prorocentrum cordatum]|uniref:Uncharacterized protein n=1 Tax=Prorocentrum cordatum TaxID=2364126 RepID=A0ABN9PNM6_9DINO|nr:unnamed protein product [Polarella glacialis]
MPSAPAPSGAARAQSVPSPPASARGGRGRSQLLAGAARAGLEPQGRHGDGRRGPPPQGSGAAAAATPGAAPMHVPASQADMLSRTVFALCFIADSVPRRPCEVREDPPLASTVGCHMVRRLRLQVQAQRRRDCAWRAR